MRKCAGSNRSGEHTHFVHLQLYGDCCQIRQEEDFQYFRIMLQSTFLNQGHWRRKMWSRTKDQLHHRIQSGEVPIDGISFLLCLHTFFMWQHLASLLQLVCLETESKPVNIESACLHYYYYYENKDIWGQLPATSPRLRKETRKTLLVYLLSDVSVWPILWWRQNRQHIT